MANNKTNNELLKCSNISVFVNKRFLVQDVSFTLEKGEIIGIVGKNKSGKTSLIKAIARALPITKGELYFDGELVYKDKEEISHEYVADISTALDPPMFYKWQTVMENIKFIAQLKKSHSQKEIELILKRFKLFDKRNVRVKDLTYFEKKKMSIVLCLICRPKLIMFDEPFKGLDEETKHELANHLIVLSKNGTSVIIASNEIESMKPICNRILFMENRGLKKIMTRDELKEFKPVDSYSFIRTKYPNYAGQLIHDTFNIPVKIMGNKVLIMNATDERITEIVQFLTSKKFIIYGAGRLLKEAESILASFTPCYKEDDE